MPTKSNHPAKVKTPLIFPASVALPLGLGGGGRPLGPQRLHEVAADAPHAALVRGLVSALQELNKAKFRISGGRQEDGKQLRLLYCCPSLMKNNFMLLALLSIRSGNNPFWIYDPYWLPAVPILYNRAASRTRNMK